MVAYNVWSSSNSMATRRLNPFPATPLSGRGMLVWPVGRALAALRKASFSAEKITEVSVEVYKLHLLTLQFFYLGGILRMQFFTCLQLR
jgi:hypothetical protein